MSLKESGLFFFIELALNFTFLEKLNFSIIFMLNCRQNHSNDNFIDLNLENLSDEEEDHLNLISIHFIIR